MAIGTTRSRLFAGCYLAVLSGFISMNGLAKGDDSSNWTYTTSKDGSTIESSRSIWLASKPGDDLVFDNLEKVEKLDRSKTKFGEFQYGGTDSRSIAIAIEKQGKQIRIFADLNRDRQLTASEEIKKQNGVFETKLDAEFGTGKDMTPVLRSRTVRFRPSLFGKSVSLSTRGFLKGKIKIDIKPNAVEMDARVFDTNGNGRFGDADDSYLADFDLNGHLNAFTERKPFGQVFTRDAGRFLLLTKSNSDQVVVKQIEGQGKVRIDLSIKSKIVSADMLLTGNDGNIYSKSFENGSEFELPSGKYTFTALSISLQNDDGSGIWHYNFSAFSTKKIVREFSVANEKTTTVSPLKNLTFKLQASEREAKGPWKPGDLMTIRPTLYSEAGLVINNCWTGNKDVLHLQFGKAATMRFSTDNKLGDVVASSGFR